MYYLDSEASVGKLKEIILERLYFFCFLAGPYLFMFYISLSIYVKTKEAIFPPQGETRMLIIFWVLSQGPQTPDNI